MNRPFYWTRVEDGPTSAPSGWYQWRPTGLVYLGESILESLCALCSHPEGEHAAHGDWCPTPASEDQLFNYHQKFTKIPPSADEAGAVTGKAVPVSYDDWCDADTTKALDVVERDFGKPAPVSER